MDRKDLKKDILVDEVNQVAGYVSEHGSQVKMYGTIAAVLVVAGLGYYFYSSSQAASRQAALAAAMEIDNSTIGPNKQPPLMNFATLDERNKARTKAYTDMAAKYRGTQEGAIARMTLAAMDADAGKLAEAEKGYRDVVDSAPAAYASIAAVSLANILVAENKLPEAEKVLKDLVDHPTAFVSKEEATVHLAEVISKSRPADARKMLEPLRTARSSISRAAIQVLGQLDGAPAAN